MYGLARRAEGGGTTGETVRFPPCLKDSAPLPGAGTTPACGTFSREQLKFPANEAAPAGLPLRLEPSFRYPRGLRRRSAVRPACFDIVGGCLIDHQGRCA